MVIAVCNTHSQLLLNLRLLFIFPLPWDYNVMFHKKYCENGKLHCWTPFRFLIYLFPWWPMGFWSFDLDILLVFWGDMKKILWFKKLQDSMKTNEPNWNVCFFYRYYIHFIKLEHCYFSNFITNLQHDTSRNNFR